MTAPIPGAGAGASAGPAQSDEARLRQAARQLTGVFAQQLFKAMRETVPQDEGVVSGGSGEEMFTGMLDEQLAGAAPGRPSPAEDTGPGAAWTRALSDAVFRHLRRGVEPAASAGASVTRPPAGASLEHPVSAGPPAARR